MYKRAHKHVEIELTDIGKRWLKDNYPQAIDVDKPFRLHAWAAEFIELTCLGKSYRIPPEVDGKQTIARSRMR